jgi:hypothetical protein
MNFPLANYLLHFCVTYLPTIIAVFMYQSVPYVHYTFLLISNTFGGGGGEAVMLLNRSGGVVSAPKSPSDPLRGQVGGGWAIEIESFFNFWALSNGIEPIGECYLGPKKLELRGLLYIKLPMHLSLIRPCTSQVFWAPKDTRLSARCHFTGPKKLEICRAQPPPTCPRNGSEGDFGAHTTPAGRLSFP